MGIVRGFFLLVTGAIGGAGLMALLLREDAPPPAASAPRSTERQPLPPEKFTRNAPPISPAQISGVQVKPGQVTPVQVPAAAAVPPVQSATPGADSDTSAAPFVQSAQPGTAGPGRDVEQRRQRAQAVQAQLQDVEDALAELRAELAAAKGWQSRMPTLTRMGESLAGAPAFKAAAADAAIALGRMPSFAADCQDLATVNGIGPIFEQRLYNSGVGTFWELAHVDDEDLRNFLQLTPLQRAGEHLDSLRSQAKQLALDSNTVGLLWEGSAPDDFERIKGIGPVFEQKLYDAGIRTYRALAASSVEQILAVVGGDSAAAVAPDITDWLEQARVLLRETA